MSMSPATPTLGGPRCIVVMGVSGCGKSSVGQDLSQALGWRFLEGDAFHPAANVERMAAGIPLTDTDRAGWLQILADEIRHAHAAGESVVLSCSALKRSYRDVLRSADPGLHLVFLQGDHALLARRVAERSHAYMPPSLLDSQLLTLELPMPAERAVTLDVHHPVPTLVAETLAHLGLRPRADQPDSRVPAADTTDLTPSRSSS
jgi:gluconokinase